MAIEASLLAQISSPCVQDVRIGIRARTAGDLDNLDWHDLDRVLVGPRFLGLEGVWLEIVYDSGAASEIEAQVRKALPNINARGTLRLCATRAAARDAPLSLIKDGHGPAPGVFGKGVSTLLLARYIAKLGRRTSRRNEGFMKFT